MRPRVLLISSRSDQGGGPRQALALAEGLGGEIDFWAALPDEGAYWRAFVDLLGPGRVVAVPSRAVTPASVAQLVRTGRRQSIEIFHSHGFGAGLLARPAALIGRRAAVHTYHGIHFDARSPAVGRAMTAAERVLSCITAASVAVSPSEHREVLARRLCANTDRLVVVVNGIAVPRGDAVRWEGRDGHHLHIASVTRNNRQKHPELLFHVLAEARRVDILGRADLACPAEDVEGLRAMARSVDLPDHLVGIAAHDDCHGLFRRADVFLASSRWEGLPLAPLEAMVEGCPAVLTDVVGHRDIGQVALGDAVGLFDPDRPFDAVELLRDWSTLPLGAWESRCAAARETVEKSFASDRMLEETKLIYERVAGGHRARSRPGWRSSTRAGARRRAASGNAW